MSGVTTSSLSLAWSLRNWRNPWLGWSQRPDGKTLSTFPSSAQCPGWAILSSSFFFFSFLFISFFLFLGGCVFTFLFSSLSMVWITNLCQTWRGKGKTGTTSRERRWKRKSFVIAGKSSLSFFGEWPSERKTIHASRQLQHANFHFGIACLS